MTGRGAPAGGEGTPERGAPKGGEDSRAAPPEGGEGAPGRGAPAGRRLDGLARSASRRVGAYARLAAFGLLAALAFGRPELVALVAPFALALVAGLATAAEPELSLALAVETDRAVVGDLVEVEVTVTASRPVARLELVLVLPPGLAREPVGAAVRLAAGEQRRVRLALRCGHWGAYRVGGLVVRAHDRWRLLSLEQTLAPDAWLKVFPPLDTVRSLVRPREVQATTGNRVARRAGDGIEPADLRPFAPGDRARSINWRATARRGTPWVNLHHPERNTDVVLFVDAFEDVVPDAGPGTLDSAVSAAAALAAGYLRERDRVGLVSFGGFVQWLSPAAGQVALYRLLDTLMETRVHYNVAWKGIRLVPPRMLPPKALVLAITPLMDARALAALTDLRARGFDLAVVDVSPLSRAPVPPGRAGALALRLWALERDALRHRYQRLGIAVVEWRPELELEAVLSEVETCRRQAARA